MKDLCFEDFQLGIRWKRPINKEICRFKMRRVKSKLLDRITSEMYVRDICVCRTIMVTGIVELIYCQK